MQKMLLRDGIKDYQLALANIPVRPISIRFYVSGRTIPNYDDGLGNVFAKGAHGIVNYATGILKLHVEDDNLGGETLTVQYAQDFSAPVKTNVNNSFTRFMK